ncbi:unnamed protein product [Clonostachys solani]|uniref:Uncharacterized protein n=1 Tax=Clonostachys solani TaxID=160281 RepID=A0A9N9W793_9HYPO|nr:unnamed protein product [Clonostachys solani]
MHEHRKRKMAGNIGQSATVCRSHEACMLLFCAAMHMEQMGVLATHIPYALLHAFARALPPHETLAWGSSASAPERGLKDTPAGLDPMLLQYPYSTL